eukprot:Pgem_evm1s18832
MSASSDSFLDSFGMAGSPTDPNFLNQILEHTFTENESYKRVIKLSRNESVLVKSGSKSSESLKK